MSYPTLFSYLSPEEAHSICKLAERKRPNRAWEAAKAVGAPALAFGGGTIAGFGAAHLADTISKKMLGQHIPDKYLDAAAPVVGGLSALAYGLYKAHEMEHLRHAVQGHSDKPSSGR